MAKRYLVIKLRHHGDVLLMTPVVHALKQREPDCEVDVLIYQETRDMVAANAQIHTIHCIDRQWKKLGKRGQLAHGTCCKQCASANTMRYYVWQINGAALCSPVPVVPKCA